MNLRKTKPVSPITDRSNVHNDPIDSFRTRIFEDLKQVKKNITHNLEIQNIIDQILQSGDILATNDLCLELIQDLNEIQDQAEGNKKYKDGIDTIIIALFSKINKTLQEIQKELALG